MAIKLICVVDKKSIAFFYDVVIVGLTPDFYSILGGVSISLCIFILMWKVYREENKKI